MRRLEIGNSTKEEKPMIIGTHDGDFHGDELFAVVVLDELFGDDNNGKKEVQLIRSRDPKVLEKCDLRVDVGGGRFDHHNKADRKYRENGVPYASFGLVWEEFGSKYLKSLYDRYLLKYDDDIVKEAKERLDYTIVQQIDAGDNSINVIEKSLNDMKIIDLFEILYMQNVQQFYETYTEEKAQKRFNFAKQIAKNVLETKAINVFYGLKAKKVVMSLYEKGKQKGYIVLDECLPYKTSINQIDTEGNIKFVISPSTDKEANWNVYAVQKRLCSREEYHQLFPDEWRGKAGEQLANVTGIKDAVFCHADGFLAVFKSKKSAIECAKREASKNIDE